MSVTQARLLREPDPRSADEALLMIHRNLYPERHLSYWRHIPEADRPAGWDGETTYEWDAGTIEWVAQDVEEALERAGVIA